MGCGLARAPAPPNGRFSLVCCFGDFGEFGDGVQQVVAIGLEPLVAGSQCVDLLLELGDLTSCRLEVDALEFEQLLPFARHARRSGRPPAQGMQVLFEAVCDEEPCGRALAAGDMFSLAVDDVAGAGQFSGPFACPSR